MDVFKLGLRNILGITLPGAVLVLVVSYVLYVCTIALDQNRSLFEWVKDAELLILVGSFLISYVVGSVIRLNSASDVDQKSSNYHRNKYCLREWTQAREAIRRVKKDGARDELKKLLSKIQKAIRSGDIPSEVLKKIGKVLSQPEKLLLIIREANILSRVKEILKGAKRADVVSQLEEVLGQIEKANLHSDIFKEIVEEVKGELQKINPLDQEIFQFKENILTKVDEANVVSQLKKILGQIEKANQDGEISKRVLGEFEEAMEKFDKAMCSLQDEDEGLFLIRVGYKRFFRQLRIRIRRAWFYPIYKLTHIGGLGRDAEEVIQIREEILIKAKDKILNSDNKNTLEDAVTNVPEGFYDWIWREEKFPYPALQFRRFKRFYPHDVFCFFKKDEYRDSVLSGKHKQTFLNYCKMVVYHLSLKLGDTLVLEVNRAEANMRFFAGTYYAFFSSCWVLFAALLVQVGVLAMEGIQQTSSDLGVLGIEDYRVINIFLTIVLGLAVFIMQQMILRRYRTLRIREVDLVNEAFYLIHQQGEAHDGK